MTNNDVIGIIVPVNSALHGDSRLLKRARLQRIWARLQTANQGCTQLGGIFLIVGVEGSIGLEYGLSIRGPDQVYSKSQSGVIEPRSSNRWIEG